MKKRENNNGFNALVATQFLDAFNDNAFKLLVSILAISHFTANGQGVKLLSLASIVFILPFILFSTFSGYVADKFNKKKIIVTAKIFELIIMSLSFFAFLHGNLFFIFSVLFLMGVQSTFLSPAKFGIMPEILTDEELSEGNGVIQMWTYIAIIAGGACGGYLFNMFKADLHIASIVFMAIAVTGILTSLFISNGSERKTERKFEWNFVGEAIRNIKSTKTNRAIFFSMIGLVYFSFFGGVFQLNVLVYSQNILKLGEAYTGLVLGIVALGLGLGSILAGKLSEHKVEFGLVPIGCIGLSFCSIALGFTYASLARTLSALFILGVTTGFYIVPLNALVQQKSPAEKRGTILATVNLLSFSALLASSFILYFLSGYLKLDAAKVFVIMGLLTMAVSVVVLRILPEAFVRLINWVMVHTLYKVKIVGTTNIPKEGGALIVCNHVSFADPVLVLASVQRPIRFMVFRPIYNAPVINLFCRITKAIPVAFTDKPKTIIKSLQEAKDAVKEGHVVCIFAEGGLTRTGNMLPFNKGFEYIMRDLDAPIIPMNIDRIWGSIFSFENGKYFFKWPKKIPYPITISVGKPMSASSKAYEVRQAVQELAADAFKLRETDHKKMHVAFVDEAKRHPLKFCMADSMGIELSYIKLLAGIIALTRKLFPVSDGSKERGEKVGILLPSSCAAAMANGAVFFAGKVPVNLNFTASKESVDYAVSLCEMRTIITSRKFLEKIEFAPTEKMVFLEDVVKGISNKEKIKTLVMSFILPASILKALFIRGDKKDINDIATVIFSSGSTGKPKGVMLSHENVTSNIQGLYQILNAQPGDVILGVLPFFHSLGFTGTLCFPVGSGVGVAYHANPLDAVTIGKMAEKYKATILIGTPTFMSAYTRKCTKEQFANLRFVVTGAEKLKKSIADAFYEKFQVVPLEGYGATELSPIVSLGIPDYINEKEHIKQIGYKEGKVGQPIPGVAVKAVDPDTYELLPANQAGLLLVKGANVMMGYLKDEEKTREVIKDGWYITGDIGTIDDDGFVCITDRLSRFSKIGGEMVPHVKVEELIQNSFSDPEASCVVTSMADEKKGERLVVLYKGAVDIDEVWKSLNESEIPKLWIPKREAFHLVEDIPILGSGKVDLKKVKEMAAGFATLAKEV